MNDQGVLDGQVIARSSDTVSVRGYDYFPLSDARMELLEKTPRTPKDLQCPHGVQFYDVVVGGQRHKRAAWSYERPRPQMAQVGGRFGFWEDVKVA